MSNKEIAEALDRAWERMEEEGFSCENYFKGDRLIYANDLKTALITEATITKLIPLNEDDFIGKVVAEIVKLSFTELLVQIDKQPTIDAVEVVRCKDCKYWSYDAPPGYYFCRAERQNGHSINKDLMGYCSDGERREDG